MLTFKGIKSDSLNLVFSSYPTIPTALRIVDRVKIPGKEEHLTLKNINYEPILIPFEGVALTSDLFSLRDFFSGEGLLIFDDYPNYVFKANLHKEVSLKHDTFDTVDFFGVFECQPVIYLKEGLIKKDFSIKNIQLNNVGNLDALPIIKVVGSGTISLKLEDVKILEVKEVQNHVFINSELDSIYEGTKSLERNAIGNTPRLKPGLNKLVFEGNVTSIEIIANWRCN